MYAATQDAYLGTSRAVIIAPLNDHHGQWRALCDAQLSSAFRREAARGGGGAPAVATAAEGDPPPAPLVDGMAGEVGLLWLRPQAALRQNVGPVPLEAFGGDGNRGA